jgi:hypothetical protein
MHRIRHLLRQLPQRRPFCISTRGKGRRYSRLILGQTVFALVCFALAPGTARADLARGTVDLSWGGFDFTTQTQNPLYTPDRDISWCIIVEPPLGDRFCLWNGAGILAVADSAVENITYAPPDITSYDFDAIPVNEQAYVLMTGDGFYVKFAVRQFQPYGQLTIEYFVQMDGTNNLNDDLIVAVQETTWGRVKSLYR